MIENPKLKGSGIVACIPQKGKCKYNCSDCFYNSGRSYLEPLDKNTPLIPSTKKTRNRIVRINDGNDSCNERELVEYVAQKYNNYFFNTSNPCDLDEYSMPVVFTINGGNKTDTDFFKLNYKPKKLMFIRIRTNTWNLKKVVIPAIKWYSRLNIEIVLTFMAYYETPIPNKHKKNYIWKTRTTNPYWCLKKEKIEEIMNKFKKDVNVYQCGYKGTYSCAKCGNCLRSYFATLERRNKDE